MISVATQIKIRQLTSRHDAVLALYHRAYTRMMGFKTDCHARKEYAEQALVLHNRLTQIEDELLKTRRSIIEESAAYEEIIRTFGRARIVDIGRAHDIGHASDGV